MIEKMLLEYAKLHRQRALFISGIMGLMSREFEGSEDISIFREALGKQIVDNMFNNDGEMLLKDECEKQLFKTIECFIDKEITLIQAKKIINKM
jgi:hypothetical protein